MARPKLPDHERRGSNATIRLNPVERAQIEHAASLQGMTMTEFFRARALGHRMRSTQQIDRDQMDKATTALLRLGVNLNQIAKNMNAGRNAPVLELADLIERINQTMDALDESSRSRTRREL